MVLRLQTRIISQISDSQFGFMPGRSAESSLASYNSLISTALTENNQLDTIYIDFAKAFDSVDHGLLIKALHKFGIEGKILKFFYVFFE